MPQRSNNLETLLMSLEILKRIPRGRKISAPELQGQLREAGFDRNLRTIQRQLDTLSEHFDIDRDERSKPYGYSWKSNSGGFSLPGLNEQESVLLSLAEQHLSNLLPASLMKSMDGFFDQARLQLHTGTSTPANEWPNKVRVISARQALLPPTMVEGILETVSNALYADHWLDIVYARVDGKESANRVMPLGLVQQDVSLYLVCRYENQADERSLALHRFKAAKNTGLPFDRPAGFSLEEFEANGGLGFSTGRKIKVVFSLPINIGQIFIETRLSQDQKVTKVGERYEFSVTLVESEKLKWWLRGFGRDLQLQQPVGLLEY